MTSSARAEGVRRGLRRGREERSHNPGGPSRRKRCTHLAAVLGVTLKLAAASFSATPRATYSTKSSRRRGVSRAFLWMSIRSFLGNWIARHNQLLWFRSNGQRLERSQVAHPLDNPSNQASRCAFPPLTSQITANLPQPHCGTHGVVADAARPAQGRPGGLPV